MHVAFFEDNYIFVDNFNISSRSYQPISWNYNHKIWAAEGPRGREPRVNIWDWGLRGEKNKHPVLNKIYLLIPLEMEFLMCKCSKSSPEAWFLLLKALYSNVDDLISLFKARLHGTRSEISKRFEFTSGLT